MNSMNGPSKDTDYPKDPGTFDQPMTEKPIVSDSGKQKRKSRFRKAKKKAIVSDSGKQKRKSLLLIKGNDSGRTEESIENDLIEYLSNCMATHQCRIIKNSDLEKGGSEPTYEVEEDDIEEVVYEILFDSDSSAVEPETEDAQSPYDFNEETYPIKDDPDAIKFNEVESNYDAAAYVEDVFVVVAHSDLASEYNEGARISDLPRQQMVTIKHEDDEEKAPV